MNFASKVKGHVVDVMFAIALFCVFVISMLSIIIMGANIYKGITRRMDMNSTKRISTSYVGTKLRQMDILNAIYTEELSGKQALVLEQTLNGSAYQTWIFHHDGKLKEIFVGKGDPVNPAIGQTILEITGFDIKMADNNLFVFSYLDGYGRSTQLFFSPHC